MGRSMVEPGRKDKFNKICSLYFQIYHYAAMLTPKAIIEYITTKKKMFMGRRQGLHTQTLFD